MGADHDDSDWPGVYCPFPRLHIVILNHLDDGPTRNRRGQGSGLWVMAGRAGKSSSTQRQGI